MDEKTAPADIEPTMANTAAVDAVHSDEEWNPPSSKLVRFYSHPWTQIILVSVIFFCLPGVRIPNIKFPLLN